MKALIVAAALSVLSLPAFAQATPSGTSSGGPGRVGIPGEVGGGVPGTKPNNLERTQTQGARMMKPRKVKKRRAMKMKRRMS